MKYKVGDKVRIVKELVKGITLNGTMNKYLGTVMTIVRIDEDGDYIMKEDGNCWCWIESMIEGLVEEVFEIGEQVGVSDKSTEQAIKNLKADNMKFFYRGKIDDKFIICDNHGIYNIWNYVVKIPKTIKIKTTDGQEREISKEKAKELGFNIN